MPKAGAAAVESGVAPADHPESHEERDDAVGRDDGSPTTSTTPVTLPGLPPLAEDPPVRTDVNRVDTPARRSTVER